MKKILISITSLTGGGAERVASLWANRLLEEGYDVFFLLYCRSDKEYNVDKKIPIYSLANDYKEFQSINKLRRILLIRKIVQAINPDVNISFLPNMQECFMLATLGLDIYRVETVRINPWKAVDNKLDSILWRLTFCLADKIIIQTDEQSDFFSLANKKKCKIIFNPIDGKFLAQCKNYTQNIKKFIAAGRLTKQKNYPMLINAFSSIAKDNPDISLDIYGDGEASYLNKLNMIIKTNSMEKQITIHGNTQNIELKFVESDCYILSSDYEGLPNTLVEAMATGLVCISTSCKTGPRDLIDDTVSGFLSSVGNQKQLENLIGKVITLSIDVAGLIGRNARDKVVKLFDEEKNTSQLLKVIENN